MSCHPDLSGGGIGKSAQNPAWLWSSLPRWPPGSRRSLPFPHGKLSRSLAVNEPNFLTISFTSMICSGCLIIPSLLSEFSCHALLFHQSHEAVLYGGTDGFFHTRMPGSPQLSMVDFSPASSSAERSVTCSSISKEPGMFAALQLPDPVQVGIDPLAASEGIEQLCFIPVRPVWRI